jgi:hypothetical protein
MGCFRLFVWQVFNPTALAYCPVPIMLEGAGERALGLLGHACSQLICVLRHNTLTLV